MQPGVLICSSAQCDTAATLGVDFVTSSSAVVLSSHCSLAMSSVIELPKVDDLSNEQWEQLSKQFEMMQQLGPNENNISWNVVKITKIRS